MTESTPRPAPHLEGRPAGARTLAVLLLTGVLVMGAGSAATGKWDGGRAPTPFIWSDVAVVHLTCALPLAVMLAAVVTGRVSAAGIFGAAGGCLAVGLTPLLAAAGPGSVLGVAARATSALGLVTGAVLLATVLAGTRHRSGAGRSGWRQAAAFGAVGAVALLVPPATYVEARCRHDLTRLGEFVEQSRVGEARDLARELAALDPTRTWNDRPLPEVAGTLDRAAADLERRVAGPLRTYAAPRERFDRGVALAMLGRTDAALDALRPLTDPGAAAEVGNLRGTIFEARGEWEPGLEAYRAARAAWGQRPPSPARAAGELRAATGVAYCLRKAGRYAEAEVAYREVLELAPTADTHFLLARFYDDAQQAGPARAHARRAMQLAPDRYQAAGDRLIRQLSVSQFGCLGVYDAERAGAGPVGLPVGRDARPE
jgi:hypothetical protein